MHVHDDRWIDHFRAQGHADVEPLAAGMEGAVYRLGDGAVAKVWGAAKRHDDLLTMQRFYAELASHSLPFATPEVLDVATIDGTSVSIERELHGRPLQDAIDEAGGRLPPAVEECLGIVIESLAAVGELPSARVLPVLDEPRPFRGDLDWPSALVALLERRVARFGDQLRAAVNDFDDAYARLVGSLRAIGAGRTGVIHGDLCGVNVLVGEDLLPTAILDWGFMSTAGDPAFDAGVMAGIYDMYGEHASALDDHLMRGVARRLSVPLEHLLVYRAGYAVATSNAYSADGADGHFDWCTATLRRADVGDALRQCASA